MEQLPLPLPEVTPVVATPRLEPEELAAAKELNERAAGQAKKLQDFLSDAELEAIVTHRMIEDFRAKMARKYSLEEANLYIDLMTGELSSVEDE